MTLREKLAEVLLEGADSPEELAAIVLEFLAGEFDRQVVEYLGKTEL